MVVIRAVHKCCSSPLGQTRTLLPHPLDVRCDHTTWPWPVKHEQKCWMSFLRRAWRANTCSTIFIFPSNQQHSREWLLHASGSWPADRGADSSPQPVHKGHYPGWEVKYCCFKPWEFEVGSFTITLPPWQGEYLRSPRKWGTRVWTQMCRCQVLFLSLLLILSAFSNR